MAMPTAIQEIDLTPLPGKTYFNILREWREEFIYFLLVDRFRDNTARSPLLQPAELRKEYLYHRRGQIHSPNGYDTYPENQHGDIITLKDYANDDDQAGSELINILIKAHCYWIREADVDGFREAKFDRATPGQNLLNPDCKIYQEIVKIAKVMRTTEPLRYERMYYRQIPMDGTNFGLPFGTTYALAFSRILYVNEVLVAYNGSNQNRNDCVIIDASFHEECETMRFLYGKSGTVNVQLAPDGFSLYVRLDLRPRQFVILQ